MIQLNQWTAKQLVFFDENAASKKNKDKKFEWTSVNVLTIVFTFLKRSKQWSVLFAYTMNSYITWEIKQRFYTTEFFNAFVWNQVLFKCSSFSDSQSVLMLDNVFIHCNQICFIKKLDDMLLIYVQTLIDILLIYVQTLIDMCEKAGIQLEYLPSYSPDFNSIEQFFVQLKMWMWKHYVMTLSCEIFENFLMLALEKFSVEDNSETHFCRAHINC